MRTVAGRIIYPCGGRGGAAAETERYSGSKHLPPGLLHQAKATVRREVLQVLRFILTLIQGGRGQGKLFPDERLYVVIVCSDGMLDVVDPRFQSPFQTISAIRVAAYPQAPPVRLIHDGRGVFQPETTRVQ